MGLRGISYNKDGDLVIEDDAKRVTLSRAEMEAIGSTITLRTEIARKLGRSLSKDIFFKILPNGIRVIVTGTEPDWDQFYQRMIDK